MNSLSVESLLGINLSLGSTEMVSILLIWVIALLLIQTILIGVLIKKSKNKTVVVQNVVNDVIANQPEQKKVEEQDQPVEEVVQPVEEEQPAQEPVVEEEVKEEVVEETPVEEVAEEKVEEEPVEETVEEIVEEEPVEEAVEEIVEEEPAAALAEEVVEEEIEDEEEEEEEEELDEEDDEEEEEEDEEDVAIGEIEVGGKALRPRYAYPTRIRLVSDNVKGFYTQVKNEFLSYGIKSRISKTKENFNFSRDNVARFVVRGKTLKLYIAIDPNSLDNAYFHHKDVSDKKTYFDIPTMMPIKSRLGANKAKELVAMLAESLGLNKKRRFQEKDFSADLTAEGLTFVEKKGFGYLMKESVAIEDVEKMPEELAERFIQKKSADNKINRFIRTRVALDDLAAKFEDGEVVTIEAVRSRGLGASNANALIVEDGKVLDKKLTVYADEISANAVKMIVLCGGEAYKIDREQ